MQLLGNRHPHNPNEIDPESIFRDYFVAQAHEAEEATIASTTSASFALPLFVPSKPQVHSSESLRPNPKIKAYSRIDIPVETDLDWALRPQPVPYEVPTSYGSRMANSVGSSSLHAYKHVPTISSTWRPRQQRRSSALGCIEQQHRQLLWQHEGLPPVLSQAAADDRMSDSESEDEGDNDVRISPASCFSCFLLSISVFLCCPFICISLLFFCLAQRIDSPH